MSKRTKPDPARDIGIGVGIACFLFVSWLVIREMQNRPTVARRDYGAEILEQAKAAVRATLQFPRSASFAFDHEPTASRDNVWSVDGMVTAQTAFGTRIELPFTYQAQLNGNGTWTMLWLDVNGEAVVNAAKRLQPVSQPRR